MQSSRALNLGNVFGYFEGCDPIMQRLNDAYHPNDAYRILCPPLKRVPQISAPPASLRASALGRRAPREGSRLVVEAV